MRKCELLAPAGGKTEMIAAINAGADAVYVGGKLFSARANAYNFDRDEMKHAIDLAHTRDVKVYVAMNTLLTDEELSDALEYASFLYEEGADALIVQDFGLAMLINRSLLEIDLHLSTQGTVYNTFGAMSAKRIGFKRVVLAREMNLDEIRAVSDDAGIETEVFVHGALCFCYSGQCQMSRHIGGRSGNKGACAQPCRLPYESNIREFSKGLGAKEVDAKKLTYDLSPKDLNAIEFLGKILDTNVTSLKIEGRMKSPEYVAIVTSIYRKYLDIAMEKKSYEVSKEDKHALAQVFNRGGFTSGYYDGNPEKRLMATDMPKHQGIYIGKVHSKYGKNDLVDIDVLPEMSINLGDGVEIRSKELTGNIVTYCEKLGKGIVRIGDIKGKLESGDKVYKITDKELMKEAAVFFGKKRRERKTNVSMKFKAASGEKPMLEVWCDCGEKVCVYGEHALANSEGKAITDEIITRQLCKTGETPFEVSYITVEVVGEVSLSLAEINDLRRKALSELEVLKINSAKRVLAEDAKRMLKEEMRRNLDTAIADTNTQNANSDLRPTVSLFFHEGKFAKPEIIKQKIALLEKFGVNCDEIKIFVPLCDFMNMNISSMNNDTDDNMDSNSYDYINGDATDNIISENNNTNKDVYGDYKTNLIPYISNVSKGAEDNYIRDNFDEIVNRCKDCGISIGNISWVKAFAEKGVVVYGDYGLNVTNEAFRAVLISEGVSVLASKSLEIEVGNFGKIPLMITEHVMDQEYLIDRKGKRYPIIKNAFGDKSIVLSDEVELSAKRIKEAQTANENIRIYW